MCYQEKNLPFKRNEKFEIVQSERVASPPKADRCGGWEGVWGGIPPAEPIVRKFGSDIFKQTPNGVIKLELK